MTLEIGPATMDVAEKLGDICYLAFDDISRRHGFGTDFGSPAIAQMIIGQLIRDEHCHSIAALEDGAPVGSNFIRASDDVGAIGPTTIDPQVQGRGLGRALMEDALRDARENGIERVRLMQDAFNMHSLSLYASLGFDTKAAVAQLVPMPLDVSEVRAATPEDMNAVERLSTEIYGVSRRREVEALAASPFRPFVYDKAGSVIAYFIPGMPGHGVGETEEALVLAVLGATRHVEPIFARAFCPLAEGGLFRRFLEAGCKVRKVMNLMTLGPYEEPQGPWMPSVGY